MPLKEASRYSRKRRATCQTTSKPSTPEIPWRDIAGIGNILRHGYDRLEHTVIWGVVENDLPPLKAAVEALLRDAGVNDPDRA